MEDSSARPDRRGITPAIVASAVFTAACAVFAIAFVGARGGLQLPVAATAPPVAVASAVPSSGPTFGPELTAGPTVAPPSPASTLVPTPEPSEGTPTPAATATAGATAAPPTPYVPPTLEPGDPLLALDPCPARPGCFEYVVARGDTLSGIISRYLLDIDILRALNPGRLDDPDLVVVGQLLLLGRDPLAALAPCPDGGACALYVVQAGDSLGGVADRYLLTVDAIRAANPGLATPIQAGQEIRLPRS